MWSESMCIKYEAPGFNNHSINVTYYYFLFSLAHYSRKGISTPFIIHSISFSGIPSLQYICDPFLISYDWFLNTGVLTVILIAHFYPPHSLWNQPQTQILLERVVLTSPQNCRSLSTRYWFPTPRSGFWVWGMLSRRHRGCPTATNAVFRLLTLLHLRWLCLWLNSSLFPWHLLSHPRPAQHSLPFCPWTHLHPVPIRSRCANGSPYPPLQLCWGPREQVIFSSQRL